MDVKTYKKDLFYSYTLGAFPTIEMLKYHSKDAIKVFIHSSFKNEEVINLINEYRTMNSDLPSKRKLFYHWSI